MSYQQPPTLLILFGQKGSVKKIIFQDMTDFKQQINLVEKLQPVTSICKSLSIINLPSSQIEISQIVPTLKYLHLLYGSQYHFVQLVFCINQKEFFNSIEQIMKELKGFYFTLNCQSITFMINQDQLKHFKQKKQQFQDKFNLTCYNAATKNSIFQNIELLRNYYLSPNYLQKMESPIEKQNPIYEFCLSILQKKQNNDFFKVLEQIEKFEDKELLEFTNKKINILCKSDLTLLLLRTQSILKNQFKFNEIQWILQNKTWNCKCCSKCHHIFSNNDSFFYMIQGNFLFQLLQKEQLGNKTVRCVQCNNTMSEKMQFLTNDIIEILIMKNLQGLYKCIKQTMNGKHQIIDQTNQMNMEIENDQKIIFQTQNSENKALIQRDINQKQEDTNISKSANELPVPKCNFQALFLTCDSEEKSFIFEKLNYSQPGKIINEGKFIRSKVLGEKFQFINAPLFSFDDDTETENHQELFKEYFKNNKIHYIFFFLDNNRIPTMKNNLISMLEKLYSIERKKMAVVVTNWTGEEGQIKNKVFEMVKEKQIEKCIFMKRNVSPDDTAKLFFQCLRDVNNEAINFDQTVFAQESAESEGQARILKEQLNQQQLAIQKSYLNNLYIQLDLERKKDLDIQYKISEKLDAIAQLTQEHQELKKDSQNMKFRMQQLQNQINQLELLYPPTQNINIYEKQSGRYAQGQIYQ